MPLDEARYQQDLDFVAMREQHRQAMKDLDMVVGRVQRLVDQYHEQNIVIARMDGTLTQGVKDIEEIKELLKNKFALRDEFLTVRNQLWAGIGVVLLGGLSALVTWIVKGGLASGVR